MKRKILLITLFLSVFISGMVTAESINGNYNGNPIVRVIVNGLELHSEVPGQIVDGSTLLPVRAVSEALGADVQWDANNYVATITTQKKTSLTQEQIKEISKSVAKIYVYDASDAAIEQGSGFIIDDGVHGKMLVTAYHVGAAGPKLVVEVNDQQIEVRNSALFKDEEKDIYGVQIDTTVPAIPYSRASPNKGDKVTAIGYPKAQYQVTSGLVTGISRSWGNSDAIAYSADMTVNNGFSGGVLLNDQGEAIGIMVVGGPNNPSSASIGMINVQNELNKLH